MASPMAMGIEGSFIVLRIIDATSTTVFREAALECWTKVVLLAHILAINVPNIASADVQIAPMGSRWEIMTQTIWMMALTCVWYEALARNIQSPPLKEAAARNKSDITRFSACIL